MYTRLVFLVLDTSALCFTVIGQNGNMAINCAYAHISFTIPLWLVFSEDARASIINLFFCILCPNPVAHGEISSSFDLGETLASWSAATSVALLI